MRNGMPKEQQTSYPSPVDQLLSLGRADLDRKNWLDYRKKIGLTEADVGRETRKRGKR